LSHILLIISDFFKKKKFFLFFLFFFLLTFLSVNAQTFLVKLSLQIKNEENKPISSAQIHLSSITTNDEKISDENGKVIFHINPGEYDLSITHMSYENYSTKLSINQDQNLEIELNEFINELENVIITAKESKGLSTSSIIDQQAMQHLQPSSFSDLMELLPGGKSSNPILNQVNSIKLREVGALGRDYNTSSMGTAFLIDGAPINSNANLQYTYDFLDGNNIGLSRRINTTSGVDMRTISTDQIEKVEIIRGIPSVVYGNLTSGVVKISRKKGFSKWSSRFKADGYSKLLALSKGFENEKKDWKINTGIDYLDAKPDPRNTLESYKRITTNISVNKIKELENSQLEFSSSLSYTASLDGSKTDPDNDLSNYNSYKVNNHFISLSNTFNYQKKQSTFYKQSELQFTINQRFDKIKQTKFVQLENAMALPISNVAGEYDGFYPEPNYIANYSVDGKPLDIFVKMINEFEYNLNKINNKATIGFDWQMSKNYGNGQIYDVYRPIDPKSTFRQRPYKDIPAYVTSGIFLENISDLKIGQHKILLALGLRTNMMMNLPNDFHMKGKTYTDPRINFQWELPKFRLFDKQAQLDFTIGYGKQSLFPDLNLLYPELFYKDIQQLNYFHNNPNYRRVHYKTIVFDAQNPELTPAINHKYETRIDLSFGFHQFSFTVFHENMENAFRQMNEFGLYNFKKYDTSAIDHPNITSPPDINTLPYTIYQENFTYNVNRNGSEVDKKGIEFQYSSNRIPIINTRITFNGAWFKTNYKNSLPTYRRGREDLIINGRPYPYLGLYNGMEPTTTNELFNTNLMLDTYVPKLDLIFSSSFQFAWYTMRKNLPMNGVPSHYVNQDGDILPFDEIAAEGTLLENLIITQNNNLNLTYRTPMLMHLNLKVTKSFKKKAINISMFANQILSYYAPYRINGTTINRKGLEEPYFGMEINFNL